MNGGGVALDANITIRLTFKSYRNYQAWLSSSLSAVYNQPQHSWGSACEG